MKLSNLQMALRLLKYHNILSIEKSLQDSAEEWGIE